MALRHRPDFNDSFNHRLCAGSNGLLRPRVARFPQEVAVQEQDSVTFQPLTLPLLPHPGCVRHLAIESAIQQRQIAHRVNQAVALYLTVGTFGSVPMRRPLTAPHTLYTM